MGRENNSSLFMRIHYERNYDNKTGCRVLKVSPRSIYKLVKDGSIPTFKIMNMWRFERTKIDQWINEKNGINNSFNVKEGDKHAESINN